MSGNFIERRKHERIGVTQAIYLEILQRGHRRSTSNTVIKCETVDVSVQGLCIYVPNEIAPGTEWERVSKLCDFAAKPVKDAKDTSRMKSILLQLKQTPKAVL